MRRRFDERARLRDACQRNVASLRYLAPRQQLWRHNGIFGTPLVAPFLAFSRCSRGRMGSSKQACRAFLRSHFDGELRWKEWAVKDWPADRLIEFIHGRLIPYLQSLGGDPLRETIRSVFAERNVIVCASGYNLKDVLEIINGIDFHSQDDIFTVSQVYEELLRRLGERKQTCREILHATTCY